MKHGPKLTFVLITEDCPYNQFLLIRPFLKGGLGKLLDDGVVYNNAMYPEVTRRTGPGHSVMSTGALGQVHGIPYNEWYVGGVEQFVADDVSAMAELSLLYVPNTSKGNPAGQTYPLGFSQMFGNGKSNRNLMADTLADQVTLYSTPQSRKKFFYVSSSNATSSNSFVPAGQLGKPFCFDITAGGFTSSTAFYPLPLVVITDAKGTGVGALATPVVVNGQIQSIAIANCGIGYQEPVVTITDVSTNIGNGLNAKSVTYKSQVIGLVGQGTGAAATATVDVEGHITAINVTSMGQNYTGGLPTWVTDWNNAQNFNEITSFTQNYAYPSGSDAYNLPNIYNDSYDAPTTSQIGIPQSTEQSPLPPLELQNGLGAYAVATVSNGVVTALTLVAGGSGYSSKTTVAINGIDYKGIPATATVTVGTVGGVTGVVTSITLTSGGSGYLHGAVVSIIGGNLSNFETTPFEYYTNSPIGLEKTYDFLATLIENNINDTDELVIFCNSLVSVTEETYGMFFLDTIDMLYHLDQTFGKFMKRVAKIVNPADTLYGWLSDEGCNSPSILLNQAGNTLANTGALIIAVVNNAVKAVYPSITSIVAANGYSDLWLNTTFFEQDAETQANILQIAKAAILTVSGIKGAYTQADIQSLTFQEAEDDKFLRYENFPARSGQLKYSTYPFYGINNGETGHVPLVLYQPCKYENKLVTEPVFINSLPLTLSTILGVPKPSAVPTMFKPLPGIFKY